MTDLARDSGICVDNDCESLSSATSSNQCSYVQRLRKRFECLAKEQEQEFHSECNWWLDEENENDNDEQITATLEVRNNILLRDVSKESDTRRYSKQSSIKSQVSRDSSRGDAKLIITPATPTKSPDSPKEFPGLQLIDFQADQETNDFDDDDDSFESDDSVDEEEPPVFRPRTKVSRLSRPISITSQTSNVSSKLLNIVRELIENEENYVRSLKAGIGNYMTVFERKELPKTLRGMQHRIFCNVKSLHGFHQHEFLPALQRCGDDPEQIAEVFTSFITRDFFYGYIIYAINRKRSELLCNGHVDFWKKVQNECGDRLGINSFLLQPIQRLPRYQLLLNEIIKDLSKDLENTKQSIAACCVAEKNVQRLIAQCNEAMSINDIRNCYEIDVLSQGKFKKMDEFDLYDWDLRRRFRGKVFIFERGLVYTESLDREHLEFRGSFAHDTIGIIHKEGKSKFKLFARKRGQNEVDFRASSNVVLEWIEMVKAMLMKFVAEEKKRNASRKTSLVSIRPGGDRGSIISTKSDQSFYSIGSYRSSNRSSSGNSSLGRDSYDVRKSQWYI